MAHIISCMLDTDGDPSSLKEYIVKPASPAPSSNDPIERPSSAADKPFVWRMHQPETRKYQLFPKDKQINSAPGKQLDPEQAFALAMGQNGDKTDKPPAGNGLRLRIKEHNLIRRRKVSVPELGPMTTVQEVPMDSPTIPGRPPLHERSISAPGNSWRPHHLAECMTAPAIADEDENENNSPVATTHAEAQKSALTTRQPLSPKSLAPLVIPSQMSAVPRLTRQLSLSRLRSGSTPVESSLRSARTDDSPRARTPYTPLSASTALITPKSATTNVTAGTNSTLPTPVSAPIESRSYSPKPWTDTNYTTVTTPKEQVADPMSTPKAENEPRSTPVLMGHRRGQSESGSIMERGRPRKRGEVIGAVPGPKRAASKRSKSAERRAFESLPKGWKASDASNMLNQTEAAALQRQALQQAARFEVLRKDDVDNLSRELRHLDERTEYLRRTYQSLRAGRRNLHSRICTYLRSPRTAKFSTESMLKQEEALAELDSSIDDWVTKLDQAENRRTRVRQKLLEHVAAAVILPTSGVVNVSESLQLAMGINPASMHEISTPPRSPTKSIPFSHTQSGSPSPQRVVAHVPSTILEQPLVEEAAAIGFGSPSETKDAEAIAAIRRADVESIRIYAGDDVYALLADVENEITKMSSGEAAAPKDPNISDEERRQLHRARSHELLNSAAMASNTNTPNAKAGGVSTPRSGTPVKERKQDDGEVFLTNAVFRPEKSVLAI